MELNKKETLEVGGSHYDMPYPPIRLIEELDLPFAEGCILKYLVRYKQKNGLEDLKKALSYCDLIIKYRNYDNDNNVFTSPDCRDSIAINFLKVNNITNVYVATIIIEIVKLQCYYNNKERSEHTIECIKEHIKELMKEYE